MLTSPPSTTELVTEEPYTGVSPRRGPHGASPHSLPLQPGPHNSRGTPGQGLQGRGKQPCSGPHGLTSGQDRWFERGRHANGQQEPG